MKQAKRKKLKKTHAPTLWIGLFMMGLLVVLAVLAPVICPYDPLEQNLAEFLQAPGAKHLFGTDQLGRYSQERCMLRELIYGLWLWLR